MHALAKYYYWALFEILVFFSYIIVLVVHLLC